MKKELDTVFRTDKVSLLLDTSSIVRIRNFSESVPKYAEIFDLYTLEKNKAELTFLMVDPQKVQSMFRYSVELIEQIQLGNIKILRNGPPYFSMPRSFQKKIDKWFPKNHLSFTDRIMLFVVSSAPENIILVTNDRELRDAGEAMGFTVFGAYELYLLEKDTSIMRHPQKVTDLSENIANAKKIASYSRWE